MELATIPSTSTQHVLRKRPTQQRRPEFHAIDINDRTPLLSKVHTGRGASRLPIRPSSFTAVGAGSAYDSIHQGHLGAAAADPNNPLSKAIGEYLYPTWQRQLNKHAQEESNNPIRYKPKELPWTDQFKKEYPRHWEAVKQHQQDLKEHKLPASQRQEKDGGIVLPLSRNIGPGNTIQTALTGADRVAQGHDLHYKYAKTDSDVYEADREGIDQFLIQAQTGTDPVNHVQGLIGAVGLSIKSAAEKIAGKTFYGNYE